MGHFVIFDTYFLINCHLVIIFAETKICSSSLLMYSKIFLNKYNLLHSGEIRS